MATRKFFFKYEVEGTELAELVPPDVTVVLKDGRTLWTRPIDEETVAVLDYRREQQKLPGGSTPLAAFGGETIDGEIFEGGEVRFYTYLYHGGSSNGICVFERDLPAAAAPRNDVPKWHVRLYGPNGKRLPYRYDIVERDGKLVIPVECGGHSEIEIAEGEWFLEQPQGCKSCGIMEPRHWRAAVQESDGWIDFDRPISEVAK